MPGLPEKITFIALMLILVSCSGRDVQPDSGKIDAVVSIVPFKNFVEIIGGDKINVYILIPPGASPHTFEPTAIQLKKISKADIYFKVGGSFHFEQEVLENLSIDRNNTKFIDCSNGIKLTENNPHIWLGPGNARRIAMNIRNALSEFDKQDSLYFNTNYERFISRIDSVDSLIKTEFDKYDQRAFLVYHGAWQYFADYYGLEELAIEKEGKEPGVTHMRELVGEAKKLNLKHIYINPSQNPKSALIITNEIGAVIDTLDTLPPDYLTNLKKTANKIMRDFK